jgi:hypothetical protein
MLVSQRYRDRTEEGDRGVIKAALRNLGIRKIAREGGKATVVTLLLGTTNALSDKHLRVVGTASNRVDVPPNPSNAVICRSRIGAPPSIPCPRGYGVTDSQEKESTRRAGGEDVPHLAGVMIGRGQRPTDLLLSGERCGDVDRRPMAK